MGALKVIALIVVLVVVANVNQWRAIDPIIYTLVVFLVLAWLWSRRAVKGLAIERGLASDRAQVGQAATEQITVINRGLLPKLWVEVRDYSSLPGHRLSRVVHLRGHGRATWTRSTTCWQRGSYRMGPLTLSSGDPFGVFSVRQTVPVTHELIVYPAFIDVSGVPLPAVNLQGGRTRQRLTAIATPAIAGLREYVPGDPLNRISWSATARTGHMMVKEFDPDPTSDVWIVLDLDADHQFMALNRSERPQPGHPVQWLRSTEDYGVTIAASLAQRCINEGREVGLIVNRPQPIRMMPDRVERQWLRVLETLAVAHANGSKPLAAALTEEASRFSKQTGVIIITASTAPEWTRSAASLVQRQVPLTVVLLDPASFDPDAAASAETLAALLAQRVHVYPVACGQDLSIPLPRFGLAGVA